MFLFISFRYIQHIVCCIYTTFPKLRRLDNCRVMDTSRNSVKTWLNNIHCIVPTHILQLYGMKMLPVDMATGCLHRYMFPSTAPIIPGKPLCFQNPCSTACVFHHVWTFNEVFILIRIKPEIIPSLHTKTVDWETPKRSANFCNVSIPPRCHKVINIWFSDWIPSSISI